MPVFCDGVAVVVHATTEETFNIESPELNWEAVESHERPQGAETHYRATLEHPALGTLSWSLWEYPEGIENYREVNYAGHIVAQDFDWGIR